MNPNFAQVIWEQLHQNPDAESIVWPGADGSTRCYTAGDTQNRIATLRGGFEAAGLKPGQSVLLAVPVSFEAICSLLAIMAAGAIPVLPPAGISPKGLLKMAVREKYAMLVIRQNLTLPVNILLRIFRVKSVAVKNILEVAASPLVPPQIAPASQPALVSHSSGSTGTPKAIRRSHSVLKAQHQALLQAFPPWAGQRDFPLFPNVMLHNLAAGVVSILPSVPQFNLKDMDPQKIAVQLKKESVETLTGNVFYFKKLLQYCTGAGIHFPLVKAVGIGGSPVPELLAHNLKTIFPGAAVYIIYGSSEAEPIAIRELSNTIEEARNGYLVGTIHPAIQVQFRKEENFISAEGTAYAAGEIGVQGAHVAVAPNEWLWTGDWGYLNKEGQLVLTGRQGNEAVHSGVSHYAIEHVLSDIPGMPQVAARATETGFCIYMDGTSLKDSVEAALATHFPQVSISLIRLRKNLPVDARHLSKIRYDALP